MDVSERLAGVGLLLDEFFWGSWELKRRRGPAVHEMCRARTAGRGLLREHLASASGG